MVKENRAPLILITYAVSMYQVIPQALPRQEEDSKGRYLVTRGLLLSCNDSDQNSKIKHIRG